jgi:hypothetical protein
MVYCRSSTWLSPCTGYFTLILLFIGFLEPSLLVSPSPRRQLWLRPFALDHQFNNENQAMSNTCKY